MVHWTPDEQRRRQQRREAFPDLVGLACLLITLAVAGALFAR